MPPVPIKFVVSFSSQDKRFVASNVARSDGCQKWLSAQDNKLGRLEGVFQLERACRISNIDIGAQSAFTIEVKVGHSSWAGDHDFETLLPVKTLLQPAQCRHGYNKTTMSMLKYDDFSVKVRDDQWDRIKLVMTQPFKKDMQFGLSLLKVVTDEQITSPKDDKIHSISEKSFVPRGTSTPLRTTQNKSVFSSPAWRSPAAQLHNKMLQDKLAKLKKEEELKNHLAKIGASAENGSSQGALLSRTTKLVMAATDKTPEYKGSTSKIQTKRKRTPTFSEEVEEFLSGLNVEDIDLDTMTYADLRHKLEKKKCRKLSKEEKSIFLKAAQTFIENIDEKSDSEINQKKKKKKENINNRSLNESYENVKKDNVISHNQSAEQEQSSSSNMTDFFSAPSPVAFKNRSISKIPQVQKGGNNNSYDAKSCLATATSPVNKYPLSDANSRITSPINKNPLNESKSSASRSKPSKTETASAPGMSRESQKSLTFTKKLTPDKEALMNRLLEKFGKSPPGGVGESPSPVSTSGGRGRGRGKRGRGGKATAPSTSNTTDVWLSAKSPPPAPSSGVIVIEEATPQLRQGAASNKRGHGRDKRGNESSSARKVTRINPMVNCPICGGQYAESVIQAHAVYCGIVVSSDESDQEEAGSYTVPPGDQNTQQEPGGFLISSSAMGFYTERGNEEKKECPMCQQLFPASTIQQHANTCIEINCL